MEDPTSVSTACTSSPSSQPVLRRHGAPETPTTFPQGRTEIQRLRAELIIWGEELQRREAEILTFAACPEEELRVLHSEIAAQAEHLRCIVAMLRRGMWEAQLTNKSRGRHRNVVQRHYSSPKELLTSASNAHTLHVKVKEEQNDVQTPEVVTQDTIRTSASTTNIIRQGSSLIVSPGSGSSAQPRVAAQSVIVGGSSVFFRTGNQAKQSPPPTSPSLQTTMGTSSHRSEIVTNFKPQQQAYTRYAQAPPVTSVKFASHAHCTL